MVKYNDEYIETANDLLGYYIDNLSNPTLDIRFDYLNREFGMHLITYHILKLREINKTKRSLYERK